MPMLRVRTVGMSFVVEEVGSSGLDAARLFGAMFERYGPAVAVLGGNAEHAGAAPPIDAMILDRKAESWDGLKDWLAGWVRGQDFEFLAWDESPLAAGQTATLHFH